MVSLCLGGVHKHTLRWICLVVNLVMLVKCLAGTQTVNRRHSKDRTNTSCVSVCVRESGRREGHFGNFGGSIGGEGPHFRCIRTRFSLIFLSS